MPSSRDLWIASSQLCPDHWQVPEIACFAQPSTPVVLLGPGNLLLQPGSDRSFDSRYDDRAATIRRQDEELDAEQLEAYVQQRFGNQRDVAQDFGDGPDTGPLPLCTYALCSVDSARVPDLSNMGDVLKVHQEAMSSSLCALSCSSACTFTRTGLLLGALPQPRHACNLSLAESWLIHGPLHHTAADVLV